MFFYSCATPTSPTGGPRDKTGPKVINTIPKSGTTNYHKDFIEFDFSKWANRSTFRSAFHIQPQLDLKYKIKWGRKSLRVEFKNGLPDSTTIIFSIGTDFQGYYGNKMKNPYTLALSTGPRINKGKLKGKLLNAKDGSIDKGATVLLYRYPPSLNKPAEYFGETDTAGVINFSYLKPGRYMAFYLDDRNRNKKWDKSIEHAQPFPEKYVTLTQDSVVNLGTLYVTHVDTVRPNLLGIGVLSTERLRLRFSEPVEMSDSVKAVVQDTSGKFYANAIPLYRDPKEDYVLFFNSEKPLSPTSNYHLKLSGITDLNGNELLKNKMNFQGSDQKDTTVVKIVDINPLKGIYPTQPLEVTYSDLIRNIPVADSLKVIQNNKVIKHWKKTRVVNNHLYIDPDSVWHSGVNFQFRIYNPATQRFKKLEPQIWSNQQLGSISVDIPDSLSDTTGVNHLVVLNKLYHIHKDTTFKNKAVFHNLPPVSYTVRVYKDLNGNGKWDSGTVEPFKAPEPYFIQNNVPVKSQLTSEIHVKFK